MVDEERKGLLQEDGGFSSYGLCCLNERRTSPYSVRVASSKLVYIVLERESADDVLGVRASAPHFFMPALLQSHRRPC